jgi:hypothetical protein
MHHLVWSTLHTDGIPAHLPRIQTVLPLNLQHLLQLHDRDALLALGRREGMFVDSAEEGAMSQVVGFE